MNKNELQEIFEQEQCRELAWEGPCHDCGQETTVAIRVEDNGKLQGLGDGAIRRIEVGIADSCKQTFVKCDKCFQADPVLRHYRPVEVYSRIVGYYRPTVNWNPGKQAEFNKRENFSLAKQN